MIVLQGYVFGQEKEQYVFLVVLIKIMAASLIMICSEAINGI